MSTTKSAAERLAALIADLWKDGFSVTGSLDVFKPMVHGLVEPDLILTEGAVSVLKIGTKRAEKRIEQMEAVVKAYEPKSFGYTGAICVMCKSDKMVANGACDKCLECGAAGGCG